MKILATYNLKGGVGKTAAAVNLAYFAHRAGARTLIWDLDPQGAASFYFKTKAKIKGGSERLLGKKREIESVVRSTDFDKLDLVPADIRLRNLDTELTPRKDGAPVNIGLDMELGVCSDICIPYDLSLDAAVDTDATRPTAAIAAALAQQPYSASEAGVRSAKCIVSPSPDGLAVEARITMPSAGDPEHVVIEPGPGEIWVSEPKTKRNGDELIAVSELVHVSGGSIALDRSSVRITVLGSKHAVDIQGCSAG